MRNQIIQLITTESGKMKHFCLKKEWWEDNKALHLFEGVYSLTDFLPEDATFRERLFYLQNDWTELQLCQYCYSKRRPFVKYLLKLRPSCSDKECQTKHKSITATIVNQTLPEHIKQRKAHKCKIKNSKSFEERYGKERADILKEQQRKRLTGTKQSPSTVEKRAAAHRGKKLSVETKTKISTSNKRTHNSPEYRKKKIETHKNVGEKLSKILKDKIAAGEFTPKITNAWTRAKISLILDDIKFSFRSSWEAAFFILNPTFVYEKIRIPYISDNKQRNYIVDFADYTNNILYEIKPNSLTASPNCQIKQKAAEEWCNTNGWEYKIISEDWFATKLDELEKIKFPYISLLKKGLANASKKMQ